MNKKAFTLIEMLVVIAIIGLLASIIVPTTGKVMDQARSSRCASNLRQIGVGLYSYALETDGRYPPNGIDRNYSKSVLARETQFWSDEALLGRFVGNTKSFGFVDQNSVLVCPSSKKPRHSSGGILNHYAMNISLYDTSGLDWGVNIFYPQFPPPMSVHSHPARTVFILDGANNRWSPGYGAFPPAYGVTEPHSGTWDFGSPTSNFNWARRHGGQTSANVLFLDGHVRLIRDMKAEIDSESILLK